MRSLFVLLTAALISGCSTTEWLFVDECSHGYRAEDPKIRCGEKWDQMHRHPFDAQIRRARGEQW